MDTSKKKSISAKKKKAKTTLANPFTLEWPSIDDDIKKSLVSSLESSLNCATVKDNLKTFIVFGYNAVMRAIEHSLISAVFVNSSVKSISLTQFFLPACSIRSIPIIAVDTLHEIANDGARIKSCLALALTHKAVQKDSSFHQLYVNCCEALSLEVSLVDPIEPRANPPSLRSKPKLASSNKKKTIPEETKCTFRLSRTSKASRVFHPGFLNSMNNGQDTFISKLSTSNDFLTFNQGSTEPVEKFKNTEFSFRKRKLPEYKETSVKRIKKNENRKSKKSIDSQAK